MSYDSAHTLVALPFFFIIIVLYFLPTAVAVYREHHKMAGIVCLNIIIGWTGLGWMLLLMYSVLSNVQAKQQVQIETKVGTKTAAKATKKKKKAAKKITRP